ncbi:protein TONSOKU [Tanacetum coccineum]
MHYSQMIRFDNAEEARCIECCSETDTEGDDDDVVLMKSDSPKLNVSKSYENDELVDDDDVPLVSLRHSKGGGGSSQDISPTASKSAISASSPVHLEACSSSHKSRSSLSTPAAQVFMCSTILFAVNSLKRDGSGSATPEEDYMCGKCWVDVSIDRWVVKRLMKLYVDCCNDLSQPPNLILLKKLYKLQVSEDEIDASDCGLEDVPAAPLLNALKLHMTIAALNISHNSLGIDSMEKLKQVFMSSSQKFGSLVLDLHCTGLSQTSLNEMCECTELLSRLEVLNISGNRLTDGSASQLSTILQNCKGLYSLNIEDCFLTSRTIQKLTNSLDPGSLLEELFIGYNSPISGNAMIDLFNKLATLKSFSKLSISGIELMCKDANDSLCKLVTTARLSELMIGSTNIKTEGAIRLMDSWNRANHQLVKLDFAWNPLKQEGGIALASLVENPRYKASVEELNLSENALEDEYNTLVNRNLYELEVADSEGEEDELANEKPCVDDVDKSAQGIYII